ncbi:Peptidoglycan hydrolase FlgJ [Hydrogenophaga sp. T4]|nr:Peptidoglycan hydrolase FlgJ [Hydrogenophaga sp. T4]
MAKFRAYDSYADSFRDYARLITKSPRYDQVMDQVGSVQGFASGLQKAGYATDPQYAAKLSRAINMTLSLQRAQV